MADLVVSVLTLASLLALVYQLRRQPARSQQPRADLGDTYLRRLDFEADKKALERRITDLEESQESRFRTLSGMISRARRGSVAEDRDELAQSAAAALAAHRNAAATATVADEGAAPPRRRLQALRGA